MHMLRPRDIARHTRALALRRDRRSLAALPAGEVRLPSLPPLPPRARRVEGGAERPRRRWHPVQIARVVFFVRRSLAADAAGNFELCR